MHEDNPSSRSRTSVQDVRERLSHSVVPSSHSLHRTALWSNATSQEKFHGTRRLYRGYAASSQGADSRQPIHQNNDRGRGLPPVRSEPRRPELRCFAHSFVAEAGWLEWGVSSTFPPQHVRFLCKSFSSILQRSLHNIPNIIRLPYLSIPQARLYRAWQSSLPSDRDYAEAI